VAALSPRGRTFAALIGAALVLAALVIVSFYVQ